MRRSGVFVLSVAAATLLSACGGAGSSRASFVDRANTICRRYHRGVSTLKPPKTASEEVGYARNVLRLYRTASTRLAALHPPKADAPAYGRWLAANRVIEKDVVRIVQAARARDRARLKASVARGRRDDARSSRLARALGLVACAKA